MAQSDPAGVVHDAKSADLFRRYESAVAALSEAYPPAASELLDLLMLREWVAERIAAELPPPSVVESIAAADRRLAGAAPWLAADSRAVWFASWRNTVGPRQSSWWWRLDELKDDHGISPIWLAVAGALLATALTLMADVALRLLSGGVDAFGIAGTLIQGFLALLAGGALLAPGRKWFGRILRRHGIPPRAYGRWTVAVSAVVLLFALGGWWSLRYVSRYYSGNGARLQTAGRLSEAMDSFTRALRADPGNEAAHFNLASAEELLQNRQNAMVHYRAAIAQNSRMYEAYNNLARLHILARDPAAAIELLEKGLEQGPDKDDDLYAFHKNLAWAHLELGLLQQAEREIQRALDVRPGAAAHCLRAQWIEKQPSPGEAGRDWQRCLAGAGAEKMLVEPIWLATAKERVLAGGQP